jgi:hypothetical protein
MSLQNTRPDFSGVWELDLKRSKLLGSIPKKILVKIRHKEHTLIQAMQVISADGQEQNIVVTYETENETINTIGQAQARMRANWNGNELVIESRLQSAGREIYFEDHWSLSDQGRTLTMAHQNDALAGQVSVLERTR